MRTMISIISVSRPAAGVLSSTLTWENSVSEGGLEPLAYILGGSPEPWLSV